MKSFIMGAIPVCSFMYLGVFHMGILAALIIAGGLVFASFCIGDAIREEFGDKRDKDRHW